MFCVQLEMLCQVALEGECPITLLTLEGLLTRVHPGMLVQVDLFKEGLAALSAIIGLLIGVQLHVFGEVALEGELSTADVTLVGLLSRVDPHVAGEVCLVGEDLAALTNEAFVMYGGQQKVISLYRGGVQRAEVSSRITVTITGGQGAAHDAPGWLSLYLPLS